MFFAKAFVIVRLSIPAKLAISILALTHYQLSYFQATVRLSSSGCGLWCYWLYGPSIWFWLLIKPVVLVSCQASCNGTYTYTLEQLSHAVRGHAVRMWPSAPEALRACNACRTLFECRTRFVRWSLTNQKIMSHLYIHFGTIVARGSRTRSSNVAFGP